MFSVFLIISMIIIKSYGNPVLNTSNITDVEIVNSGSRILCDQNVDLTNHSSLFELLNHDRIWFVLARSKFVYGDQTWNNVLMQTSTIDNGTTNLQFIGENSNGSCVNSEKGHIASDTKLNRVSIQWSNEQEGFIEMVFIDELMIHFNLCYSMDSNTTDICAQNQSEHFVVQNNQQDYENDTISWLKSHCSSINPDDFVVNNNTKKCVPVVSQGEIVDVDTTQQSIENNNETTNPVIIEQENATVTEMPEFDNITRSNRTNRLEILEEYYSNVTSNATKDDEVEATTVMEVQQITVVSSNVSINEDSDRINVTVVEEIEPVANETVDGQTPLIVLHKTDINETVTNDSVTEEMFSTELLETNDTIELNNITTTTTPIHLSTVFVNQTTEKQVMTESSVVDHHVENSTVLLTTEPDVDTTTTELTTSTAAVPADCPVLKDCPFDHCTFARKNDNRGCPTCNCLYSNKSNLTCPPLTCQACPYGHYTDPNGCPICQCQNRPYPPLGERCPQLNCEPCYFGTVRDEYNCDTCVCIRPNNQECPRLNCTFGLCKYGSIKDEDDCPTCDCLLPTNNITEVNCTTPLSCPSCHLGYIKDADGCQTCQCKLRGSVPCTSIASECQCEYGSYLNSNGCETCLCLPDPKNASRQACWELANQATFRNISGPTCSSDGSFNARQCDPSQSKCWCVTPSGINIIGFESEPAENVNCACAVELYQVSSLRMIGHHLLCLLNGNYAPIQCDGRYCSCVDENGKPIGPSVSIQNRDQLRCVGVYQQLHPERFILHRATFEHSNSTRSSLCLTHLEQVRHANITDDHILIPVCDANGLYAPVQCDQSERYCWCVDKKTGVEMEGTRRLNARPNCNLI